MTFRSRVLGLFAKRTSSKQGIAKQKQSRRLKNRALFLEGLEGRQLLAAEVNVLGNSLTIADGDVTPDTADHTQFNSTLVGATSTRTYTIQNTGDTDLSISNPTSSSARFAIQNFPAGPIAAGGSATFNVVFTPSAGGNVTGTISFANDDADENPYNFDVLGPGVANSAPVFSQASYGTTVNENTPNNTNVVFDPVIAATDANTGIGDTITYSIVAGNGTGGGAFKINATTGQIQVNDVTQLDMEQTSSFSLTIRATDSVGAFGSATANIFLFNVPETPKITAGQVLSTPENRTVGATIGTVATVFDVASTPASRTFTILSGNGSGAFAISNAGVITVANSTPLNFEVTPSFTLSIRATDNVGVGTAVNVVISLTNVNETPTNIGLTPTSVAENQASGTTVGTLSTTDVDAGDTFTYTLVPGTGDADNASFSIVGNSLKTAASFNFEVKNSYAIRLRTTDAGGLFFEKEFTVSVTNGNDAPTLVEISDDEIEENEPVGTTVGAFSTTDEDAGETFTYSLEAGLGGDDNASFTIVGNELRSAESFDFETKSSYTVRVRSTDSGGLFTESVYTINILDVGEGPTDISLSNASLDENNAVGDAIGMFSTTDADPLDTFTYTFVAGEGDDDNASFTINGDTLKAAESFDFEAKSSYTVRVRSTDPEMLFYEKVFVISVNEVPEAPTAIALSNSSVLEDEPVGTPVGMLSSTDEDTGETFTYTLVAGAGDTDNASFTIAGDVLKSAAVFNFPGSYSVRVRTTDSDNLFTEQAFTISISDVRIGGFAGALPVAYRENGAPALIGSVGTVTDVELLDFDGGTLTAWLSANGTSDDRLSIKHTGDGAGKIGVDYGTQTVRYGGVQIATYTGGTGTTPLVLTFNATALKAGVQAVLKAITFANVSDNPSTASRTVSFVITDGDGGLSNTASRTVNVTAVNDKPVATASGSTVGYTENTAPVVIDNAIVITDVDSANFDIGKLTVKVAAGGGGQSADRFGIESSGLISVAGNVVSYNGTPIGTFAGTTTLTVTLNSDATPAIVQELARHVTYWSISDAPSTTPRQISFTISDGDGGTSLAALGDTVNIALVNDAPVLTLSNATSAKYTENAAPTLISSGASVLDVDLLNFDTGTLTVELTGNGEATDVLSIKHTAPASGKVSVDYGLGKISYTNTLLVTYEVATFTGGDGINPLVITFNSSALKTEVQAVMKAITFASSSDNPSTAQRTVSFTLTDGDGGTSNTVVRSVDITLKNDAPVVAAFGADVNYSLAGSPVIVTNSATISDVDSADFNTGKLIMALTTNKQTADRVEIQDGNGITASAGTVSYNGDVIGTYAGTTTLTITFNSAFATPTAVQALLRQLTFRSTSTSTLTRTVTATVYDGDGGISTVVSKSITVS